MLPVVGGVRGWHSPVAGAIPPGACCQTPRCHVVKRPRLRMLDWIDCIAALPSKAAFAVPCAVYSNPPCALAALELAHWRACAIRTGPGAGKNQASCRSGRVHVDALRLQCKCGILHVGAGAEGIISGPRLHSDLCLWGVLAIFPYTQPRVWALEVFRSTLRCCSTLISWDLISCKRNAV